MICLSDKIEICENTVKYKILDDLKGIQKCNHVILEYNSYSQSDMI